VKKNYDIIILATCTNVYVRTQHRHIYWHIY